MQSRRPLFALSLIIAVALAHASRASGQDYPFPSDDVPGMKSPGTATTLSLLGTVAPLGLTMAGVGQAEGAPAWLLLGGLVVGPSLGYFYAGDTKGALKGLGLRTAVLGATMGTVAAICSSGCSIWGDDNGSLAAAGIVALAGLATTTVFAIRDIARADDTVRARNERIALAAVSVDVSYVPEVRAPGVVFTLRR